jgi:hypothetical protein
MVDDIRVGPPEEYWDRLRSKMGADGLITYWYLGRAFNRLEDVDTMSIRQDMRNPGGGIMAAPLAIAAPETGGWRDRDVIPAPVAYSLQIVDDAVGVTQIRVVRSTVAQGKRLGFSRSEIVDASQPSRVIAITTGIGVSLGDAPPGFRPIDLPPDIPDAEDLPPLHVVFGARRDAEGWRLPPLNDANASTSASLHLGPIHVAFEAAATESVGATLDTEFLQVESWDVHFLRPGKVGPFLVRAEARTGRQDRAAARLTMTDEGNDGAPIASGAAMFRALR